MTPAAQAEAYARQALRFAWRAGAHRDSLVHDCSCWLDGGRFDAWLEMKHGTADTPAQKAQAARRYACAAARAARATRALRKGNERNERDEQQEEAAYCARAAAACAGYAARIEREKRP